MRSFLPLAIVSIALAACSPGEDTDTAGLNDTADPASDDASVTRTPMPEDGASTAIRSADPANSGAGARRGSDTNGPDPASPGTAYDRPDDSGEKAAAAGPLRDTIPARFHGTYGETDEACAQRSHARFTVSADRIQFFESYADVLNVRVDGDYAAVSAEEQYVETTRYVFYMALEGEDRLRYRYDRNPRKTWVRCV